MAWRLVLISLFVCYTCALTFGSSTTSLKHYWQKHSYVEGNINVTYHVRKLLDHEFKKMKSMSGFDGKELVKICSPHGGSPPTISEIDESAVFRELLSLDDFQPYMVDSKYPAKHGFYLSAMEGSKAALWVLTGGTFQINLWHKNRGSSESEESSTTGQQRQDPDDVVCVVRRQITTSAPPTQTTDVQQVTTTTAPGPRCSFEKLGSDYDTLMYALGSTSNKSGVSGDPGTNDFTPPSRLDWFLIRHRYWVLGTALLCLALLCFLLTLISCLWFSLRRRESDVEKVPMPSCEEYSGCGAMESLLPDSCGDGFMKSSKLVVHVPNTQPEIGSIAARRHRDTLRRSLANMTNGVNSECLAMPISDKRYHTLGPRLNTRQPAIVMDCAEISLNTTRTDEDDRRSCSNHFPSSGDSFNHQKNVRYFTIARSSIKPQHQSQLVSCHHPREQATYAQSVINGAQTLV